MRPLVLALSTAAAAFLRARTLAKHGRPALIITGGPTGAGKSSLQKQMKTQLTKMGYTGNYVTSIVDDLVEQDEDYKDKVMHILYEIVPEINILDDNANAQWDELLKQQLTNPSKDLLTKFADAYFFARKNGNCGHPDLAAGGKGCDAVNDAVITQAIENRENIIFETTVGYPGWLIDWVGDKYDVYYAASLVGLCRLFARNTNRAYFSAVDFLQSPVFNGPRLPDVSKSGNYGNLVQIFKQTLVSIAENHCMEPAGTAGRDEKFCGKFPLTGMFIYDNNERMTLSKRYDAHELADADEIAALESSVSPETSSSECD
jgi:polyhydroxyalkanoate synthesis regulator phasin